MMTLEKTINYKIYENGSEFLLENAEILKQAVYETAFFRINAQQFKKKDSMNYAIAVKSTNKHLLLLRCSHPNTLLFGNHELLPYGIDLLIKNDFKIENILGEKNLIHSFLKLYQEKIGGAFNPIHSLSIMVLKKLNLVDTTDVLPCTSSDLDALARYYCLFSEEALHKKMKLEDAKSILKERITDFYILKQEETIVSIASKAREEALICAISNVYTNPKYRGKGFSKKLVCQICEDIIKENKTPYLFVDNANVIANRLYLKLGFEYRGVHSLYHYEK